MSSSTERKCKPVPFGYGFGCAMLGVVMSELKRCPFCGGNATLQTNYEVWCDRCQASRPSMELWNTRPTAAPEPDNFDAIQHILNSDFSVEMTEPEIKALVKLVQSAHDKALRNAGNDNA